MGIGCQWNGCWLATNHLSGWPVQPIKELSSATGRYAGRGCALIRQLANAAVPFWRPSSNLPDGRAASRQKYHSLGQMLNGWNSLKHFAHPSRNFYRGGGSKCTIFGLVFWPKSHLKRPQNRAAQQKSETRYSSVTPRPPETKLPSENELRKFVLSSLTQPRIVDFCWYVVCGCAIGPLGLGIVNIHFRWNLRWRTSIFLAFSWTF